MDIEILREKILKANEAYRKGDAIISDSEYDALLEELNKASQSKDPLLAKIGFEVLDQDSRKEKLPVPMHSMNKVKSFEEIQKWFELKKIDSNTEMLITPKYDGLSFCVDENKSFAWTRGNGILGQRSDPHLRVLLKGKKKLFIRFLASHMVKLS